MIQVKTGHYAWQQNGFILVKPPLALPWAQLIEARLN